MGVESKGLLLLGAVKPNPSVLFKRLGDEMVLFNLETDRFYELNGTAAHFWELLVAGHPPTQLRAQMLEEFDVDSGQFAGEAESFINLLRREDLVKDND
jgi:hypothetical protein